MQKSKPGRNRVEAWIYGVINPLTEALERERNLTGLRIASYNRRSESLDRINLLRGYLSRGAVLILDDLIRSEKRIVRVEKTHDARVLTLADSAHAAFLALVNDAAFVRFATRAFSSVADDKRSVHLDVAEDLVNDKARKLGVVAHSYDALWNRNLEKLVSMQPTAEFTVLRRNLRTVCESSEKSLDFFEGLRVDLVEEYDVPPAPLD